MKDVGFLRIQSSTTQGLKKANRAPVYCSNCNTFSFGGRYFATQSTSIVHRFI